MDTNFIIIIFTVAVSIYVIYNPEYKSRLLHYPYNVNKNKEYYRLISNGFIHADFLHLFFNMYVLYIFGPSLESYFLISSEIGWIMKLKSIALITSIDGGGLKYHSSLKAQILKECI